MEHRPLHFALFAVSCFAVAVGCTAPVGAEVDAGTASKLSVVEVRAWHAVSDGSLNRLDAAARFVSVREPGLPADALELLGLAWPAVTPGTCTLTARLPDAPLPAAPVRVDLRDLSPVTLLLDSTPVHLEPRAFPDVAGLVSGVVFVAPAELAAPATTKAITLQVGQGLPSVYGLELPDLPSPLRLVDAVSNDGTFTVDARGLDVLATPARPARADDRVVVEVLRAGVVRARCGVDAGGRLHVEGSALGGVGDATLVIRAQRRVVREDAMIDARLERAVEVRLIVR